MRHGLDYEDLARARNVMWFEIKIKWIQKSSSSSYSTHSSYVIRD